MSIAPTESHPVVARPESSQNPDVEDGEIVEPSPQAASVKPTCLRSLPTLSVDAKDDISGPLGPPSASSCTSSASSSCIPPVSHSMTAEDLDRAKDIVLDLLGWGVAGEYLVEFEVTKESGIVDGFIVFE
ncbi:hypothetical protein DFH09DRAFT_1313429 [Mycena vulgaris]|nr:hypothetical protein DFH09DRAFT_1313429 [Mycena vulgaris]